MDSDMDQIQFSVQFNASWLISDVRNILDFFPLSFEKYKALSACPLERKHAQEKKLMCRHDICCNTVKKLILHSRSLAKFFKQISE